MSAQDKQATLIGEPSGEHVSIETDGRVIKPFLELSGHVVSEAKLLFDDDGLHIRAVDPPNVAMVDVHMPAEAFEDYDLNADELMIGVNIETFQDHLREARHGKGTSDPVSMMMDETHTRLTIEREYTETTVKRRDEFLNIDPRSVRARPDIPDLDLCYTSTVDVQAFKDVVDHFDSVADHVQIRERDGHMICAAREKDGDETIEATEADFGEIAEPAEDPSEGAESLFSLGYMTDFATALKKAKIDRVKITWGEEFPAYLNYERERDGEMLYSGLFCMAPRIQSD